MIFTINQYQNSADVSIVRGHESEGAFKIRHLGYGHSWNSSCVKLRLGLSFKRLLRIKVAMYIASYRWYINWSNLFGRKTVTDVVTNLHQRASNGCECMWQGNESSDGGNLACTAPYGARLYTNGSWNGTYMWVRNIANSTHSTVRNSPPESTHLQECLSSINSTYVDALVHFISGHIALFLTELQVVYLSPDRDWHIIYQISRW